MLPAELLPLLRKYEGLHRLGNDGLVYPYLCPAGFPTQGYGSLVKDLSVPPITPDEAEARLETKASEHLRQAMMLSPGLIQEPERRQAAIASFIFNLGSGRYQGSTLRRRVNAKDWDGAIYEIQKWVWGGGKKLSGLILRRAEEASMLR